MLTQSRNREGGNLFKKEEIEAMILYIKCTYIPGGNFINVKRVHFSHKRPFSAAFLDMFQLWRQNFVQNLRAKMLMKLMPEERSQRASSNNANLVKKEST